MATTAFHEVLTTVRTTAAAHASALDELERVFTAQTAALAADQEALEAERGASLQRAGEANARERVLIAEEREAVDRDRADWEAEIERMTAVQPSSEEAGSQATCYFSPLFNFEILEYSCCLKARTASSST